MRATTSRATTSHAPASRAPASRNAASPDTASGTRAGPGGGPADVAVLGGGVIGLVTAWRTARRGLRVTVVDPEPGGGAARVAAGMLAAVTELHYGEETLLALNLASAARYPDFVAELEEAAGLPTGYRACGTLAVALDADDRAHLRELHALQQRCGLDAQWLTGRECRRLEPLLSPAVRGGARVDGDHQIDPRRLVSALLLACERAGVAFRRARAVRLLTSGDRATGVELEDGTELPAGQTVLALGSRSGQLAGVPPEVLPPVRPVKGQVLRLRMPGRHAGPAGAGGSSGPAGPHPAPPPFLDRTVRAVVRGGALYLVPREDGELVVGATSEELGWDTTVTAGGVYELLRDAHELVPGITELPLAETCAGLRPASPDNAPLLGPTALPGLHLATGHYRNGVLLTPVTGDIMAELLTSGQLPEQARPFTPQRFSHPQEQPV
ncbi:glycine oxidase ThiO [Streptomyces axinellae]|uniref:Glycine oxidase ThiO n=1 Tax=Streptomyces axinellae TaxID=552788 RepID=A0ABP6C7Z7_9ACTN